MPCSPYSTDKWILNIWPTLSILLTSYVVFKGKDCMNDEYRTVMWMIHSYRGDVGSSAFWLPLNSLAKLCRIYFLRICLLTEFDLSRQVLRLSYARVEKQSVFIWHPSISPTAQVIRLWRNYRLIWYEAAAWNILFKDRKRRWIEQCS